LNWLFLDISPSRPVAGIEGLTHQLVQFPGGRSDLLARCDALARKLGISRAGLIARGIRAVLAAEGRL
jgi:hypothetical protein